MKNFCMPLAGLYVLVLIATSCQKELTILTPSNTGESAVTVDTLVAGKDTFTNNTNGFTTYTILGGNQYCENNSYLPYTTAAMHFVVRFDSSAIYTNANPQNQYDYNKLYGFSDNMREHHAFSARFGWRWCNNQLQLSAYTYNDSIRTIKDIGSVPLNADNNCAILVEGDHYKFVLNGDTTTMLRTSKTPQAMGYKLLPYFGGDEIAPHTITIAIKELE